MEPTENPATARAPWNKGKIVGQKTPFKLREIWAIRVPLQIAVRRRERVSFPQSGRSGSLPKHRLGRSDEKFPFRGLLRRGPSGVCFWCINLGDQQPCLSRADQRLGHRRHVRTDKEGDVERR